MGVQKGGQGTRKGISGFYLVEASCMHQEMGAEPTCIYQLHASRCKNAV